LLHAAFHFQFDKVYLKAFIAFGNFGGSVFQLPYCPSFHTHALGRQGSRGTLCDYDAIACFIDKSNDEFLLDSKEELNSLLSDDAISQPIVILVQTPNASGTSNDPNLISEFELEDVIRRSNGRVSIFAYSLSATQFVGCIEGKL
jgi:hypothetical protein